MNTSAIDQEIEELGYGHYQRRVLRATSCASFLIALTFSLLSHLNPDKTAVFMLFVGLGAISAALLAGFLCATQGRLWTFRVVPWLTLLSLLVSGFSSTCLSFGMLSAVVSGEFTATFAYAVENLPIDGRQKLVQQSLWWLIGSLVGVYLVKLEVLRILCGAVTILCYFQRRTLQESLVFLYETRNFSRYHAAFTQIQEENGLVSFLDGFCSMEEPDQPKTRVACQNNVGLQFLPFGFAAFVCGLWLGVLKESDLTQVHLALAVFFSGFCFLLGLTCSKFTMAACILLGSGCLFTSTLSQELALFAKPLGTVSVLLLFLCLSIYIQRVFIWTQRSLAQSLIVTCFIAGLLLESLIFTEYPIQMTLLGVLSLYSVFSIDDSTIPDKFHHTA